MINQDFDDITATGLTALFVSETRHLNFGGVEESLLDKHFKSFLVFTHVFAELFLLLESASDTGSHFDYEL